MPTASELPIDTSATALEMAESMFGSGIEIVSADYTGHSASSGVYSDGDDVAPQFTPSDTGVILSTGRADSVTNSSGEANTSDRTSGNMRTAGDDDLTDIAGFQTYDAAVFEATFVPDGSMLTMQIVFSSEEYLEYVGSGFNDAVGIWVNGVQAELTVGSGDITINNINDESNQNLYVDNPSNAEVANTEMDGFTVTLTLKAPVNPGEENTIKIGIADAGDSRYDSNLLIAGDSIQCVLLAEDDEIELAANETTTVDLLDNDAIKDGGTLTITHINGQPVNAGDEITLATGETIILNADGTITLTAGDAEGESIFTYQVADEDGNTDTAFVNVETTPAPCFVKGTLIVTQTGTLLIEELEPGHMILTRDNGFQPLRWVGQTARRATGQDAPVHFAAGALGNHDEVEFSPNHRVLLNSSRATLLFGESEVLVKAKDLVNGDTITFREDGASITYVHLLFDRHEIVRANGLDSESYHPGQETIDSFDADTRNEILRLMPNTDAMMGYGFGPAARVSLRKYETKALIRAA